MSDDSDPDYPWDETPPPAPPRIPLIPWVVVLLVVALILNRNHLLPARAPVVNPEAGANQVLDNNEPLMAETVAAKLLWGVQILSRVPPSDVIKQLEPALKNQGPRGAIALAIVEASTVGSPAALKRLEEISKSATDAGLKSTMDIVEDWVRRRAKDPLAPITDEARKTIKSQIGWFATIPGNAPPSPEDAEFWVREPLSYFGKLVSFAMRIGLASLIVIALIASGLVALIFLWIRGSRGALGPGLNDPGEESLEASPIFMETFALWIAVFFSLNFAVSYWVVPTSLANSLIVSILVQITSLGALAWPLARGMSFTKMREMLGLSPSDLSLKEIPAGIFGTLAFWPVMLVLLCLTAGLIQSFPDAPTPEHPLPMQLAKGSRLDWWLGVFAAVVMAPIVEEIFFRGFLFRHLRESSRLAGVRPSFWISALMSSILFAAVHPQGILGLPALGGLATLFCLLRETRNSLVASIAAHAMGNGTTLLLLSLIEFN